jgi:hypothetical protein
MKAVKIAGKNNLGATFSLFSNFLLCIVFSHPQWCEAQQTTVRQKPIASPRQFTVPTAPKQAPNQTAAQTAPQQGAIQTGTQAGTSPVGGDTTRPNTPPASAQTQLLPGKTNNVTFTDRLGGSVFSSGTEDIRVSILPNGSHDPRYGVLWTEATTVIPCDIYLVSPEPGRFIGHNFPGGGTMNLGKLPEGEVIFAIKTFDGYTFQNGGADRNPDKVVHAFTRTFPSGQVEVWFEDSAANGDRRDNDMDDVAIRLSGGVRGSGPWADLQRAVDQQSAQQAAAKQAAEKGAARNAPETPKPQ